MEGDEKVIRVSIDSSKTEDLQEGTFVKWGFEREAGNQLVAAMQDEHFKEFLRVNNLILYKNHIKEYQDGDFIGDFGVVED